MQTRLLGASKSLVMRKKTFPTIAGKRNERCRTRAPISETAQCAKHRDREVIVASREWHNEAQGHARRHLLRSVPSERPHCIARSRQTRPAAARRAGGKMGIAGGGRGTPDGHSDGF